jgi:hypothetical protein
VKPLLATAVAVRVGREEVAGHAQLGQARRVAVALLRVVLLGVDGAHRPDGRRLVARHAGTRRPGTAMAAMMPMIATTINSSINVKPFDSFASLCSPSYPLAEVFYYDCALLGSPRPQEEQPICHRPGYD